MAGQHPLTWVLEVDAFASRDEALESSARQAGHQVVHWSDEWWNTRDWPSLAERPVLFHGSLGNAARIRSEIAWQPGAFCDVAAFHCSAWYPRAREWLANDRWQILPANQLVSGVSAVLAELEAADRLFVRPDSPLKPFSGRVLAADGITLAALDHGFYYDDPTLPVVVAPVRAIGREWRYVVADRRVVAGSAYSAAGRTPLADDSTGAPWQFATDVAARLEPPERVYVLDVCETEGHLRLLELNPFSGADLYACRADDIVAAVVGTLI